MLDFYLLFGMFMMVIIFICGLKGDKRRAEKEAERLRKKVNLLEFNLKENERR